MRGPGRPANLVLRARICALLENGPMRATAAYCVLHREGWTYRQIDHQRRYVAGVKGKTFAASWVLRDEPQTFHRERYEQRKAGKFHTDRQPVEPERREPRTIAGRCPHGFTVTTKLHGAFACALCEEAAA